MSELDKEKYLLTKLAVIGGSAIIGGFGSGFISFLIVMSEALEGLLVVVILCPPIGFLVGGGMAMWLLGKQIPIWKVVVVSILVAFLVTSLLMAGLLLILYW
jgi:hypothetical protein